MFAGLGVTPTATRCDSTTSPTEKPRSANREADVLCQPPGDMWTGGTSPGTPLATPSRRWRAAQTARVRARPAARPAQNCTRRPPQRLRAAETANGNGRRVRYSTPMVGAACGCKQAPGVRSYGAAVTLLLSGRGW